LSLALSIKILRNNLVLQYVVNGVLYGTDDHLVWESRDKGETWKKVCQLQPTGKSYFEIIKDKILRSRMVRAFRRNIGINNLVVLDSGTIIAQYDKIYRLSGEGKYAEPVYDLQKEGLASPLKNGLCYDRCTGHLYFGEYIIKRPAAVRIIRGCDDGRRWEVCYQFSAGQIRHVHGIFPDPYRKRIWVCTGDNDRESGLYYTDNDFQSLNLYGSGDQSWRMVSLLITPESLIWGTDAGQDTSGNVKNYIYKLDLKAGTRKKLCCIDKPAYYSTLFADGSMCIATTFEPKIKREVIPSADLWWSKDGIDWGLIDSFPYKFAGRKYGTKYATIFISGYGTLENSLYCTLVNVGKFDFQAVKIDWVKKKGS